MKSSPRYDVAFFVPAVGPLLAGDDGGATGGAETQIFQIARALSSCGLRTCLCTYAVPGVSIPSRVDGIDVVLRRPYVRGGYLARIREAAGLVRDLASI